MSSSCTDDDQQLKTNTGNSAATCALLASNNLCSSNCANAAVICCTSCSAACASSVPSTPVPDPASPSTPTVPWSDTSERILGVTNGYRQCIGVPDTATARANGCVFSQSSCTGTCALHTAPPTCDAGPAEVTNVGLQSMLQLGCTNFQGPGDGIVVVFSSPVRTSTVDASDFVFTLSDGSTVTAACAVLAPANEENERETVLTIGQYHPGGAYPVSLSVAGSLFLEAADGSLIEARGMSFSGDMRYETSKIVLLRARLETLPLDPIAAGESAALPRVCRRNPPHTLP